MAFAARIFPVVRTAIAGAAAGHWRSLGGTPASGGPRESGSAVDVVILWWSAIIPSIGGPVLTPRAPASTGVQARQTARCSRRCRSSISRGRGRSQRQLSSRARFVPPSRRTDSTTRYTWFRYATKSSRNAVAWSSRTSSMVGMRVSRAPDGSRHASERICACHRCLPLSLHDSPSA